MQPKDVSSTEIYSASHNDRVMTACCLELHEIGEFPKNIINPETNFQSPPMPQSESDITRNKGNGLSLCLRITPCDCNPGDNTGGVWQWLCVGYQS
jgi:hypothetical protein